MSKKMFKIRAPFPSILIVKYTNRLCILYVAMLYFNSSGFSLTLSLSSFILIVFLI